MKTIRDVMTPDVIRVGPTNKIKTAIILMRGHNVGGLPVMDGDQVIGMLNYQDVLGKDNEIPVQNIMDTEFVTVVPDMLVTDAAELMTKINTSRLLVVEGGQLTGVVTRGDLIPELGKSFDPITGLPRADSMRDWGITALKQGRELTVIFLDLDQFGQFNKKYGHIIGDKVLQHVAKVVLNCIDEQRDMLCRYAGDEFVIVTTRHSEEAFSLAHLVAEQIRSTPNPELPEPVTGSIGVHGGKRTKEREDVHYNSTLDNLINLASKSCTIAKGKPSHVVSANAPATPAELSFLEEEQPMNDEFTPQEEKPIEPDQPSPEYGLPTWFEEKLMSLAKNRAKDKTTEEVAETAPEAITEPAAIEEPVISVEEQIQEETPVQTGATQIEEEPIPEEELTMQKEESTVYEQPTATATAVEEPKPKCTPHKRLRLKTLNFTWNSTSIATTEVVLSNGDVIAKQSQTGYAIGNNALRLVADATAQAVCDFLPSAGFGVVADEVRVMQGTNGETIIVATALVVAPQYSVRVSGSSIVRQDTYVAVAAAMLDAINRQISTII